MRIGLIAPPWTPVPPPLYGGIELVVDGLARGFAEAGHEVVLFTTGDSTCPVERRWVLEHAEGSRIGFAVPELRHAIAAHDSLVDCDVVHDHTLAGPALACRRPVPGRPVLTTIHGPLEEDLAALYLSLHGEVPVIAISEAQRRDAPHVPVAAVIHHGIDARSFPLGDGTGDAEGEYCLFLGRMAPDKGAHRAIEVARKAGVRLLMAAKMREPAEVRYFTEMVEPMLGPDAVYLGEVPHEQKVDLLCGARALLFPIRWNEPFGMVMLEAMACGTPVLAFREGAAPEVVDHGRTGFLCDDEEDMVAALAKVPGLDRHTCREAVEGYFSVDRMVADHLALFESVLAATPRRG
ncbi:MAG TPA: glycosyltransferase family 4 protein [Acidimicrobiales bacterium]|nr:glycosyltransferase family 4 protein [Acidimicrobiales bacterium]